MLSDYDEVPDSWQDESKLSANIRLWSQIAPMFTMPVAGELCTSSLGWESVYYLHGIVTIALFTVFIVYHRNAPTKHPLVKPKELMKVMFGKGSIYSGPGKQRVSKKVPYAAMYKDPAIWAILVAAFGNFMGTQLSLQFMPTYINKIVLVASTCILGFNSGGFFKSSQMVSRQHSHFTLANIAFVNCTCMLLTPLLSELIAPDNTPETWSIVLCLHGVILLTTNAFFCVFGSARPASWTFVSWSRKGSHVKPIQPNRQKIYDLTPDRPKIDAKL
ncbi:Putative inorganic phosphate cotransporter [Toxocara canis]|uniref:Putative inorganic phosphate cotransporter n=1 Tax=Toxocara canis TaxID=6265 RepID=A0A0B2VCK1_TOXCA|nr:Putative inorganic phosphate cotransporter [Toxocara canis]